jgi:uncharacterized protein (DUF1697 family)
VAKAVKTYVAFLRAINVGGNNKISMGDLRSLFGELGFVNVRTLLQSGNVVFSGGEQVAAELEVRLEQETKERCGVGVDYVVRSAKQIENVIAANPFPDAARDDPGHLVVMFLKKPIEASSLGALRAAIKGREEVEGGESEVYITYPDGIGTSKLTIQVIEKHLGCRGTARNWNTTLKVVAALADLRDL